MNVLYASIDEIFTWSAEERVTAAQIIRLANLLTGNPARGIRTMVDITPGIVGGREALIVHMRSNLDFSEAWAPYTFEGKLIVYRRISGPLQLGVEYVSGWSAEAWIAIDPVSLARTSSFIYAIDAVARG